MNLSKTDCSKEGHKQTVSIKMIFLGNKEDFLILLIGTYCKKYVMALNSRAKRK